MLLQPIRDLIQALAVPYSVQCFPRPGAGGESGEHALGFAAVAFEAVDFSAHRFFGLAHRRFVDAFPIEGDAAHAGEGAITLLKGREKRLASCTVSFHCPAFITRAELKIR
jgi:hypothetical protein